MLQLLTSRRGAVVRPNLGLLLVAQLFGGIVALLGTESPAWGDSPTSPDRFATRIDRSLSDELFSSSPAALAPISPDAIFLRRVYLDLLGDIPTPAETTAFLLDQDRSKRTSVVRSLLARSEYGQNWARYWRDVMLSRRVEDRSVIVAKQLVFDLANWLNQNESWDEIASKFICATGDVRENGATAIYAAQDGRTEETTAEFSRIFLGIQLQCAQCHDHPYDRWKREEFHELAAFFPRVGVRPVNSPTKRSFEVFAVNPRFEPKRRNMNNRRRPLAEHYMSDLDDPAAPGTRMQPKFFLTSQSLPFRTPDADRREELARWLTGNEWFAMAIVNRMWAELVGEGFYEPVDDIGPDRSASSPATAELLKTGFIDSRYDIKWLIRTIMATDAYQRECRPRRTSEQTPFVATIAQPLRSDQLFNSLLTALELDESDIVPGRATRYRQRQNGPRQKFAEYFGYDPSDPRDSIAGSIPQTLAMMNMREINARIMSRRDTALLGRLLSEIPSDFDLVNELYLRTLCRLASDQEVDTAFAYIDSVSRRQEAYEDLMWALLNSTEFSHRR